MSSAPQQPSARHRGWERHFSRSQKLHYWFDPATGERLFEKDFLLRFPDAPTASRAAKPHQPDGARARAAPYVAAR